jgi:hypothetical protein
VLAAQEILIDQHLADRVLILLFQPLLLLAAVVEELGLRLLKMVAAVAVQMVIKVEELELELPIRVTTEVLDLALAKKLPVVVVVLLPSVALVLIMLVDLVEMESRLRLPDLALQELEVVEVAFQLA